MSLKNLNIFFVRHGNAEVANVDGQQDRFRRLTEIGKDQAIALSSKIGHDFDVVITSPAARTHQMAMLVGGEGSDLYIRDSLLELPDPEGKAILERMYAELGHASFAQYMQHADFETLLRFAKNSVRELMEILEEYGDIHTDVLVVGHGVLTNAVIFEMFPISDIQQLMLQTQLGECGCIRVQVDENGLASAEIFN